MIDMHHPQWLFDRMTDAAATVSAHLVPGPLRWVVDRTIVDVACATSGGVGEVARTLQVDVPAVDAWRSLGVPTEFRGRLTAMTVWPPLRPTRALGQKVGAAA